ncbi:carbohydrate ABC transporter permease [Cellulomonas dongxiuzhuiae]|uniref:Sugar ABC transporter permease n=1 Tax=Cellulomonas dongxiuzhuiae TaxID=2819979 RepID=A0ABX8GLJ2_9CELL|nr:sugar ABC transporter permease [Cellulomonas dongxiuzhuiae]MBO3089809.1 sugar ABC transporter permease [Cellulomonas dongxiuzhuiae]MBO3095577.1 sugar ABC transporter permease [Cellulomonas dongxiuzhuiae]QWC16546.1 sugar ABC transporter permease [Cellulomonas dongxiuzhuiae]
MATTTSTAPPVPAASTASRRRTRKSGWWLPYALLAPAVLLEVFIHLVPMLTGIWMSFTQLTRFFIRDWTSAPFVGLRNYQVALDVDGAVGRALLSSFGITCAYTVLVVGISWSLGMAAAVALQRPFRSRALFRTLFLVPYALPVYAGIVTWNFMLQRDNGVINHLLVEDLGLMQDKPFWLIGGRAFASIVIVAIWRMWPFAFLMLTAGLQSVPDDVYEAAAMDGAHAFRSWWSITLPMLRPVNLVLVLVMFLWVFNDFNTPYVLFGTAQPAAGDLISFHIYNASFLTWNFGAGAAMSVLLLLFLLLVTGIYLITMNRRSRRA